MQESAGSDEAEKSACTCYTKEAKGAPGRRGHGEVVSKEKGLTNGFMHLIKPTTRSIPPAPVTS